MKKGRNPGYVGKLPVPTLGTMAVGSSRLCYKQIIPFFEIDKKRTIAGPYQQPEIFCDSVSQHGICAILRIPSKHLCSILTRILKIEVQTYLEGTILGTGVFLRHTTDHQAFKVSGQLNLEIEKKASLANKITY